MLKKTLVILSLLNTCAIYASEAFSYGLSFHSHSVNQDIRTSLDLGGGKTFHLPTNTTIEFDLKLNRATLSYGYVFRIISSDVMVLDLVSNANTGKANFILTEQQSVLSNIEFTLPDETYEHNWKNVKVKLQEHDIICSIDSVSKRIPHPLKSLKNINIYFGKNQHPVYHTTDVPPMAIKDIAIIDGRGEYLYKWHMCKHQGNRIYDEIRKQPATFCNGICDIDKHAHWEKEASFTLRNKNPQIAYDSINARIFIVYEDSIICHNLQTRHTARTRTKHNSFFQNGGSQLIYDQGNDRLMMYCYENKQTASFDAQQRSWSASIGTDLLPSIQQHNRFIDTATNRLVLFGGYGNHKYNSNLIIHHLGQDAGWQAHDLSGFLKPRYLSALGYIGDSKFIVMGGYGSTSGKQEEFPENMYDVLEINIADSNHISCVKLGELPLKEEAMTFSNSMVVDTARQTLYALAYCNDRYKSHIQLVSFDWGNGKLSFLADTIPYNFLDIESFCDMFLYKGSAIYAIVLQKDASSHYVVNVYSLTFPPLNIVDVTQSKEPFANTPPVRHLYYCISLLLIMAAGLFVYIRKKKPRPATPKTESIPVKNPRSPSKPIKPTVSTIKLLGGFQVFDKNGKDITDKFTPILKQLFLLILLSTSKNGKKVTSERLDESFWSGMDKVSAANNRNVNIRKLRLVLNEIGNINVAYKSHFWSIELGDDITCDYGEIMRLLKGVSPSMGNLNRETLDAILSIAQEGVLLPNIKNEWVEDYKAEYTDTLINILSQAIVMDKFKQDLNLCLHIANVLLLHDNIDEDAIRIKCNILSQLGQKGAAKQCYDKFAFEYNHLLNEQPGFTYEDIFSS